MIFTGLAVAALAGFSAYTARKVEKALPPRGRFIEVDGARLHYLEEGSGPTIVMIHGLGAQLRNFTHSLVGRLANDHRVVVLDRPGAGYSTRARNTPANLRAQATTIAHFMAALQLERPLVVGHSLGGAIALALAIDHPEAVGGLALIAPLTHPQDAPPDAFKMMAIRSSAIRQFVAWTIAVPAGIIGSKAALEPVFGPEKAPSDFAIAGGGALWLRPSSFYSSSTDLVAANDDLPAMGKAYGTLALPVSILFGTKDRILDHHIHGEAMQGLIPGVELTLVPDAGHMLPLTQPDATAAWIRKVERRIPHAPMAAI